MPTPISRAISSAEMPSSRYNWSAGGRINVPYELLAGDAFRLQIEGQWLSSGWRWVGAHEEPRTERGARADLDSHRVPLDLNALIPIPRRVLRKGFVEAGQEWMWANWGVRWPIRRVTFAIEHKHRDTSGVKPVAGPD